jgi:uncharacterized membrane protein YozB (DUF420 family)
MAALFLVTAVVGFGPTSLALLATVDAGERPPLPLILHVHAVCMTTWLLLLLVQTSLVAAGRTALHRSLGLAALVVAPAAVAAMIGVAFESWRAIAALGTNAGPEWMASIAGASYFLLEQIRSVLFFAVFVGWALVVRRKDPETHKRMMLLATLMPLGAAITRIEWLPTTLPGSYVSQYAYLLLWLAPALIHDIVRRGAVHRAYVIGIALVLPYASVSQLLWGSDWWVATAPRLMGVAD